MTNKELIERKKAQIKALEEEIKNLRGPRGIASVMNENFAFATHPIIYYGYEWGILRKLILMAFRVKKVNDLDEDQIYMAAEMADELLKVWNKYYELIEEEK